MKYWLSDISLDRHQLMGVLVQLLVENAGLVEVVDADLSGAMKNLLVANEDADMGDRAVFGAEESQVTWQRLLQEINELATSDLLGGIARKVEARHSGANLYKAGTVDAKSRAATPEIWRAEQFLCIFNHDFCIEMCRCLKSSFFG